MADKKEVGYALRLDPGLYERLRTYAEEHNRSINQQIVQWIERGLAAGEQDVAAHIADLETRISILESHHPGGAP